jgi:hypothetical protein
MNPYFPQYVPSSTSERTKRIKTDHITEEHDSASSVDPLDTIDIPMDEPRYEGELGFGGRFSNWTPDHVVLECLDGTKLSIAKAALCHSRSVFPNNVRTKIKAESNSQFFKDMFDISNPSDDPQSSVPTFVTTEQLYILLVIIEDQVDCKSFESIEYEGKEVCIRVAIELLSLKEKVCLEEMADRFDCEVINISVKQSLGSYYSSETPWELLTVASNLDLVPVAKAAIIGMQHDYDCATRRIYRIWWTFIEGLRPSWQVELTKLFWDSNQQLVDRPHDTPRRTITGRKRPRTRECVLIRTGRTFKEIAEAFNPKLDVSLESEV